MVELGGSFEQTVSGVNIKNCVRRLPTPLNNPCGLLNSIANERHISELSIASKRDPCYLANLSPPKGNFSAHFPKIQLRGKITNEAPLTLRYLKNTFEAN
jgi:hypothetical protein